MAAQMSSRLIISQRSAFSSSARRSTFARSALRRNPHFLPAIAIFIQQHSISTETVGHGGSPAGPPPGFNVKEAQKPLPKERALAKPAQVRPPDATTHEIVKDKTVLPPLDMKAEAKAQEANEAAVAPGKVEERQKEIEKEKKKKEDAKLTLWQKVKKEAAHYWDGTKLLGVEIKISSKLALKMAAGYDLSRREHRQLQRTVQDIVRLVPFSMFVIVPFAELLLPFAIKFFPNLLPSTYEGEKARENKNTILRATRKDTSSFLRTTIRESGLPLSPRTREKEEFTEFFRKVRTSGETPSHQDAIAICKAFKDDLTLDNLSRPQLVSMCRYMNLSSFGTDMMLRYTVRHRMRQIKRDDKAIFLEGVNSLSVSELQTACASRGIRTYGISPGRLRDDLSTWLDLRLKHNVPSILLVMSNAFMYNTGKESEIESYYDALIAVLSSIPEELFHEIELEINSAEGAATNKQRLEVLKEQQELIEEENEQAGETGERVSSKLDQDIDEKEKSQAETKEAKGVEESEDTKEVSDKEKAEKSAAEAKEDKELEAAMERHENAKESAPDPEVERKVDEKMKAEEKEKKRKADEKAAEN